MADKNLIWVLNKIKKLVEHNYNEIAVNLLTQLIKELEAQKKK
ncbi:MAG: hypothetical protein WC979_09215 [Candidatus Pacearchaeota archaeon]